MGKAALLTLDYGYADFAQATFTSNDFRAEDVAAIQHDIDSTLVAEQQVRGGLEFRIKTRGASDSRCWQSAAAQPLQGFDGVEDGTLLEDGSQRIQWAIGGEYRAETWYAGATYRHTSTEDARRLYALSPAIAEGRTGLGLLMLSIGARY